jgi:hypothetical protein
MKKVLSTLILSSVFLFACKKDKVENYNTESSLEFKENSGGHPVLEKANKPIFRLTWSGTDGHGGPSENCNYGRCGSCIGICVKFGGIIGVLTNEEIEDGYNYANISLLNDSTLLFIPNSSVDNGDGTTNITEDFLLSEEISGYLGKNSVIIRNGIYSINYRGGQYGQIIFDVITN